MKESRVFIEITSTRAISSDPMNWILMKRTEKEGGGFGKWSPYSYPRTFESAAKDLEEELIKTCGARSFGELGRMADKIHTMLAETFKLAEGYKHDRHTTTGEE